MDFVTMTNVVLTNLTTTTATPPTPKSLQWIYGFLATTGINLASILGALSYFCTNPELYNWILMAMIALGVGSMSTVSIINLIPQILKNNNENVHQLSVIMVSIFVFCIADQILKMIRMRRDPKAVADCRSSGGCCGGVISVRDSEEEAPMPLDVDSTDSIIKPVENLKDIPTVVFLVLLSDGMHNFVDGLTIGAAFASGASNGFSIVLAIMFEELPCELGDFAIFLKSGLSTRRAICFNLLGSSPNYVGLIIGILLGDFEAVHDWVYAIAAGMFLYISLSVMLVELVELQMKVAQFGSKKRKNNQVPLKKLMLSFAVQNATMILGFVIQLIIVLYA